MGFATKHKHKTQNKNEGEVSSCSGAREETDETFAIPWRAFSTMEEDRPGCRHTVGPQVSRGSLACTISVLAVVVGGSCGVLVSGHNASIRPQWASIK